jgi:hypothetical protein
MELYTALDHRLERFSYSLPYIINLFQNLLIMSTFEATLLRAVMGNHRIHPAGPIGTQIPSVVKNNRRGIVTRP